MTSRKLGAVRAAKQARGCPTRTATASQESKLLLAAAAEPVERIRPGAVAGLGEAPDRDRLGIAAQHDGAEQKRVAHGIACRRAHGVGDEKLRAYLLV